MIENNSNIKIKGFVFKKVPTIMTAILETILKLILK